MFKIVLESQAGGKERGLWMRCIITTCLAVAFVWNSLLVAAPAELVTTGNRLGQLGPCGCAVDPKGGLERLLEWSSRQASPAVWVDSGNNLFSLEEMNPDLAERWKESALLMADAYRQMPIDVLLAGPKDFTAGADFLKAWLARAGNKAAVAANLSASGSSAAFWKPYVLKGEWGVTGVVPPTAFLRVPGLTAEDPMPAAQRAIREMRAAGARRIVLLSAMGLDWNRDAAGKLDVQWIVGSSDDMMDEPLSHGASGKVHLWHHRREAQSVVHSDGDAIRETFLDDRFDPVGKKALAWKRQASRFTADFSKRAVAAKAGKTNATRQKGHPFVANQYVCKNCHQEQYGFWEKTQHASAYLVLFAKYQHFDPECIGCHSLGFGEKGGFRSIADPLLLKGAPPRKAGEKPILETVLEEAFSVEKQVKPLDSRKEPERYATLKARFHEAMDRRAVNPGWDKVYIGVQCEHCHGNRDEHVFGDKAKTIAARKPVSRDSCLQCHNAERDPDFSFDAKISKVACPRIAK